MDSAKELFRLQEPYQTEESDLLFVKAMREKARIPAAMNIPASTEFWKNVEANVLKYVEISIGNATASRLCANKYTGDCEAFAA